MLRNTEKRWEYTPSLGSVKDTTLIIRRMLERGWKQWGLIIDLTRRSTEFKSLYDSIEAIKNGFLCSTKYETDFLEMSDSHIVIFSNKMPQLEKISSDRWKIYEIVDNDTSILLDTESEIERCIGRDIEVHQSRASKNHIQGLEM